MSGPITPSSDSDGRFAASDGDDTDAPISEGEDAQATLRRELTPGTIVAGKYRVEDVLGAGGMGLVVAATHVELGELVALKFLLSHGAKQGRSRFLREAKVCARLRNEHITRVLDVGTHRRWLYMVMEHLRGRDLRSILREGSHLPLPQAVDYAVQICEGLAEAHAHSIVHRDLKPTNLFITRRPDGSDLLKILDFGISKWQVEADLGDDLTQTGVILGTPRYMAPEQLLGSSTVDARADVWSVGAILYEMIAGKPPYDQPSFALVCAALANGTAPPKILEHGLEVPAEIEDVIARCLEPNVAQRVQNVADLAGDLLAASGASVAPDVRARLLAMLEGNTPSPATGNSGSYATLVRAVSSTRKIEPPPAPLPPTRRWLIPTVMVGVACVALLLARSAIRPAIPQTPPSASTPAIVASSSPPAPSPPLAEVPPQVAPQVAPPVAASPSPSVSVAPLIKGFIKVKPQPSIAEPAPTATPAPTASASAPPKSPFEDRL
jgi:serine/threonine protein kinase